MAKLIFGCGYLGRRVARLWTERGERVMAVTRRTDKAAELAAEGIEPLIADLATSAAMEIPPEVRTVLWAVGYDGTRQRQFEGEKAEGIGSLWQKSADTEGESLLAKDSRPLPSIEEVYVGGLARVLAWLPTTVARLIYISSTGVYGDFRGEEIDEDAPCQPKRAGGKACLLAEQLLQGSRFADRTIILRLAGLYGPERIPRVRELAAGKPIDAPASGWLNLIHVDDAARIVLLAEERAPPPRTYVVSDGQPVQRRRYYEALAELIGAPPPQFVAPASDSPAALRAASDKRIRPTRMFAELAPKLSYPSFRQGLAAIVAARGRIRE